MKFPITDRVTGKLKFTAEIGCSEDAEQSIKVGLAVKWAIRTRVDLLAGANLARANLADAYLADAYLAGADLTGAHLTGAHLTGANLAGANLTDANLTGANLAGANLTGAYLARADLARADLAGANLAGANLAGAYLTDANLAGSLKIDEKEIPIIPNIDATILAAIEAGGKFNMSSWHEEGDTGCGTSHCRAGWAIHLAGPAGYALEEKVGPGIAGAMIYRASRPGKPAPWFFAPTEKALADISECAADQTA